MVGGGKRGTEGEEGFLRNGGDEEEEEERKGYGAE